MCVGIIRKKSEGFDMNEAVRPAMADNFNESSESVRIFEHPEHISSILSYKWACVNSPTFSITSLASFPHFLGRKRNKKVGEELRIFFGRHGKLTSYTYSSITLQ